MPRTSLPNRPCSSAFRNCTTGTLKRFCLTTNNLMPARSQTRIMASASSRDNAIGFSTTMCLPYFANAHVCSAWRPLSVRITTTSTSASVIMRCMSVNAGTPNCDANFCAFASSISQTADNVAFGICPRPSNSECRLAILPQPTSANLSICRFSLKLAHQMGACRTRKDNAVSTKSRRQFSKSTAILHVLSDQNDTPLRRP